MRCPYCREEIHDQALKCPHCERLLVPKPGWQRRSEEVAGPGSPTAATGTATAQAQGEPPTTEWVPPAKAGRATAQDGGQRSTPRRGLMVVLVALLVVGAAGVGFLVGRTTADGHIGFVSGDAETVAELEAVAEQRRTEIERLQQRLADAEPTPEVRELRAALVSCEQALGVVIEREAALFADQPALSAFVRVVNRCLAPLGRSIEIPST